MEENQKINCSVTSCKYNNELKGQCILQAIQVSPTPNNTSKKADESMCSSYEYHTNN